MKRPFGNMQERAMFLRNTVFGVEDSLVSTVGLLSGIAATGSVSKSFILLTGIVYISVEAFSQPALGAFIMFVSFALAGFVPILPYLFFAGQQAILVSVIASLVALFLLGMAGGGPLPPRPPASRGAGGGGRG